MINEKRQVILDEGVSVQVFDYVGTLIANTKALLGRASTQNFEMRLEHYRRMQFLPDVGVINGHIVKSSITSEYYLVLATMNEVIYGQRVSVSSIVVDCNIELKVEGIQEKADKNGNIAKVPVVKADKLKAHIAPLTADLKQYDPGLHSDAEFRIFAPAFDFNLLDKVTMVAGGKAALLKVVAVDYVRFDGIVSIDVKTETRK